MAAAVAGAYVHGAAGDSCFQALGPYGYSPVEVADAVPQVLQHMEAARVNPVGTHSLLY
jgi:NAD(P)H-hydrate repair Nnr-like enzyme with NAD(P)H-hydrate dehydratase domain